MKLRTRIGAALIAAVMASSGIGATASADEPADPPSLAGILLSDGDDFDTNPYDFDIVTQAVLAVLDAKPASPVSALLDGNVALTAFIPNDRAFQLLAGDVSGNFFGFFRFDEQKVFETVASLGIDTVENVLLYHVVVGDPISSDTAANVPRGTVLTTALGVDIKVNPIVPFFKWVSLQDQDRNDIDPFLVPSKLDINKGNPQVAHGIGLVLRPVNL